MDSRDAGRVGTHPRYVPIDEELLRRLYVDERLTGRDIARQLGCGEITILRRLRRFGIPVRPRGPLHQAKTLNRDIRWSPNLAYAVGLIATDGNLKGAARNVDIEVIRNMAILRGTVPSEYDRQELAARIAQVPGITSVDNRLIVALK